METQPTTRKARMTKYLAVEACIALVLLAICPCVLAQSVRTGPMRTATGALTHPA